MRPPSELGTLCGGLGQRHLPSAPLPRRLLWSQKSPFRCDRFSHSPPHRFIEFVFFVASFFHFTITTIFLKLLVFFFFFKFFLKLSLLPMLFSKPFCLDCIKYLHLSKGTGQTARRPPTPQPCARSTSVRVICPTVTSGYGSL